MTNKKPCNECPFRKESAPGYLGEASYNPELFLQTMEHEPLPCHCAVDWEDEDNPDDVRYEIPCIGSLQFLKNTAKLPRNMEYAKLRSKVVQNPDVFQTKQEFIEHHLENDSVSQGNSHRRKVSFRQVEV